MSEASDINQAHAEISDELFLNAANHDGPALARLATLLTQARPHLYRLWPAPVREMWQSGLEVVLDGLASAPLQEPGSRFLQALLAVGFNSQSFRDLLAAAARQQFTAYPDPAGLIRALGIMNPAVPTEQIARQWERFAQLREGIACFHPAHGHGTIKEIDGFSNTVFIHFSSRRAFPLEVVLSSLYLIKAGSFLEALLNRKSSWDASLPTDEFKAQVNRSLVPAGKSSDRLLEQLLVPAVVTEAELHRYFQHQPPAGAHGTGERAAAQAVSTREWFEARNLEELADLLSHTPVLDAQPERLRAMGELFLKAAAREDRAAFFATAAARLWLTGGKMPAIQAFLRTADYQSVVWRNPDLFAETSDGLNVKLIAPWFEVTAHAVGPVWLADAGMLLPMRLFTPLTRVFENLPDGTDPLYEAFGRALNSPKLSADVLLWLWRSDYPERLAIADSMLILKTLTKIVHGNYLKASKDLRKLLLENDEFQRFLLHDGDPTTIISLVQGIRHVPLLDGGERQSLLVRIVRLYPEAKNLVEERQTVAAVRPVGKITSPRSFELHRRELEEIINVKIPANSRALAHARGYGDLRENAEFKAAKENQRLLRLQRAELERAIHEIRAFDFGTAEPNGQVIPGSIVELESSSGRRESYTILGLWDGDTSRNFISYEAALSRELLGRRAGDKITLPEGGEAVLREIRTLSADLVKWLRGEDLA